MINHKCEGKRQQVRRGISGIYKCTRNAVGIVETHLGFTETHHVCSDNACFQSITSGYPASFFSYKNNENS